MDLLARLWWINTKNAGKPSNPMPEPIPRPGVEKRRSNTPMRMGDPMSIEELNRRLIEKGAGWTALN